MPTISRLYFILRNTIHNVISLVLIVRKSIIKLR